MSLIAAIGGVGQITDLFTGSNGNDEKDFDEEFNSKLTKYSSGQLPEDDSTFGFTFMGKVADYEQIYNVDVVYGGGIIPKSVATTSTQTSGPQVIPQTSFPGGGIAENVTSNVIPYVIAGVILLGGLLYFLTRKKGRR